MLAAELKKYDERAAAGEAPPPQPGPSVSSLTPSLDGLQISAPPTVSQSLPSGGHMNKLLSDRMLPPKKPRVRPAAPGISQQPIPELSLPEPSPHSNSLLDHAPIHAAAAFATAGTSSRGEEEEEDVGGTSMIDIPASSSASNYPCAASAPATMLWGPAAMSRRAGVSAMGGRTPSKTLLEALATRDQGQ